MVLYFVDEEYRILHPNILKKTKHLNANLNEALQIAEKNKLSYCFCRKVLEEKEGLNDEKIETKLNQANKRLAGFERTLRFVSNVFGDGGIKFLVIKTFKGLPYATFDVDVSVRKDDFEQATLLLKKNGVSETDGRFINPLVKLHLASPGYWAKGLLKIDMYEDLPFSWLRSLDHEYLWKQPRVVDIEGIQCSIPHWEADILSEIASALFTDRKITLLDFLYFNSLLKKNLNFEEMSNQTEKYGWKPQFQKLLSILQSMQQMIYRTGNIPRQVKFPYIIPFHTLLESLRGPLRYKISKQPKSLPFTFANIGFHIFMGPFYASFRQIKHD